MVAEKQYTYSGLTLGDGDFPITLVEGLDMPDSREDSIPKGSDHGAWTWAQFVDPRRIVLTGHLHEEYAPDMAARVQSLRSAFSPKAAFLPLSFHFPGEDERRVYCVPTRRHFPYSREAALAGYMEWTVELIAEDPRIYSETEKSRSGTGNAANDGSVPSYPVIDILGPSVNPVLRNDTTGEEVALTGNIGVGETWFVDFLQKTIRDQDGVSKYGAMNQIGSDWWSLLPGSNALIVSGGGTFTVRWRDAWL